MNAAVQQEIARNREWEETILHRGFRVSMLRKVMDKIQNQSGWKLPWAAGVPHDLVGAVLAAVDYFHADAASIDGIEPFTGYVLMSGRGYQG